MKPNVCKVVLHEGWVKLFTGISLGFYNGPWSCFCSVVLVLIGENGVSTVIKPVRFGDEDGTAYAIFDFKPGFNVEEVWVAIGSSMSRDRSQVAPLLRLLPCTEKSRYVMERGKHYTFKLYVKLGELKVEQQ